MHAAIKSALPILAMTILATSAARAESYRRLGTEFEAMRSVALARDSEEQKEQKSPPKIVVVEFLHHGLIHLDAKNDPSSVNLAVVAKNGDAVPVRLLQFGPGDFCRVAFQPVARQRNYEIYYGGEPPSPALLPKWSTDTGLLFESREYINFNLRNLGALREAFEAAKPIGSDYVPSVHHAHNPTDVGVRPFLSRYSGKLRIKTPGEYLFWTASQDCSFLTIDDRTVVAAPGRHGPFYQAKPQLAGSIKLDAGLHDFEYYHAATGTRAMMVVAWTRKPHKKTDRPALLPPEWFGYESIVRAEPRPVTTRTHRLVPDFDYRTEGDVPLPDSSSAMIGVTFRNRSLPAVTTGAKLTWDFGDGQTSTQMNPSHVFLKPGLYRVSLSVKRGGRNITTTSQLQIDRPYRDHRTKEKAHQLDDYLPILTEYDPATLDAGSARQLAIAYQWKGEEVSRLAREAKGKDRGQKTEDRKSGGRGTQEVKGPTEEEIQTTRQKWLRRAVDVGLQNLKASDQAKKTDDRAVYELALLTGSIARFDLGNSRDAFEIYRAASRPQTIRDRRLRAECATRAADIAVNELLDQPAAKTMLSSAANDLGMKGIVEQIGNEETLKLPSKNPNKLTARFFRVLGDYAAVAGQGTQSLEAYQAASTASKSQTAHTRDTARRGAYSRSTEQFLKDRQLDRAAREIDAWIEQFPGEKVDGYFTLLYARLLFARGQFQQAVNQCEQLATVNGGSPYLDRLLLIAAESQNRLGHPDRAEALLRELIDSHPGSPLVPEAKKRL